MPVPKFQIGTLHSFAYHQLGCPEIAESHLDEWNESAPEYALTATRPTGLDDLATDELPPRSCGDDRYQEYNNALASMVPRERCSMDCREFARRWERWKHDGGFVSFTDLITLALEQAPHAPGAPDVLIVDEAQDFSRLELALCRKWGEAAGAVVFAADPHQALYTWRGADPSYFTGCEISDDHRRALRQSFRVPEAVRRTAVGWLSFLSDYRPIEYRARRLDVADPSTEVVGEVANSVGTWKHPEDAVDEAVADAEAGRTVIIAASCSYMLTPSIAILKKRGVPFSNPWRPARPDWNPLLPIGRLRSIPERLLDFLRPSDVVYGAQDSRPALRPRWWSWEELRSWGDLLRDSTFAVPDAKLFLKAKTRDKGLRHEVVQAEDLKHLFGADQSATMASLFAPGANPLVALAWLDDRMLPARAASARYAIAVAHRYGPQALRDRPRLHVGSIHSYKGAEAQVVYLFPDLSAAANRAWTWGGAHRDSVIRTFYVGMTRASDRLTICTPSSASAVHIVSVMG